MFNQIKKKQSVAAVAILIGLLSASGCRTPTEEESDVANLAPVQPPQGNVNTVYADFAGDDARLVFDGMKTLGKRVDTFSTSKTEQGRIRVNCNRSGFPPGAQGMPGPIKYSCTAGIVPASGQFPPGAVGLPAPAIPPFFTADGDDTAQALGMNLKNVTYAWDATMGKYKISLDIPDGNFSCLKVSDSSNGNLVTSYKCLVEANNAPVPTPVETTYADFSGDDAKLVFNAMKTLGKRVDTFSTGKIEDGHMTIYCERSGIPPGAMGMPGPATYSCNAGIVSPTANFPPGAQGMQAPALPPFFSASKSKTAAAFGKNLQNVQPSWDASVKKYVTRIELKKGHFACVSKATSPNAKKTYSCTVIDTN